MSISSPRSGATVSNTVTVSANASDNRGVAGVQFKLDGANLGGEDTSAPYSVSWNTSHSGNGSHTLTAVARDAAGNRTTSAPVTVTVSNAPPPDTTAPSVRLTAPAEGSTVSGTVMVSANATDNERVAGVLFQVDGVTIGSEDTSAPYSVAWNTATASDGRHTLTAVARDAAGNRTTSAGVAVTVSNETGGPPPSATRFEETAATFAGSGWTLRRAEIATFSGGAAATSNVAGDTARFTFTGTGISWIGLKCNICGIASVSIDGGPATTVNTASSAAPGPGLASEVVYSVSGLAAGSHTIVITVSGTTSSGAAHVTVDAFDVIGGGAGGPPPTATRLNEDDAAVTYTGPWVHEGNAMASGGTFAEAQVAGAVATLRFTGTEVRWVGYRYTGGGIARVLIDGRFVGEVDTYSASAELGVVFTAARLPRGPHTLTIEVTGRKNPAAGDSWVIIDGFEVTP